MKNSTYIPRTCPRGYDALRVMLDEYQSVFSDWELKSDSPYSSVCTTLYPRLPFIASAEMRVIIDYCEYAGLSFGVRAITGGLMVSTYYVPY